MHGFASRLWKYRFAAVAVLVFALLAGWGIASLQAYERQQQTLRDERDERDAAIQAAAIERAAAQAATTAFRD